MTLQIVEAALQRLTVKRDFLGRRRCRIVGKQARLEKLFLGGNDIFDLGTGLRLLKR